MVAVYSKCDENALFVNQVDEAVSLGAASLARETYLDMDKSSMLHFESKQMQFTLVIYLQKHS